MSIQRITLNVNSMEPNYSIGDYFTVIEIDPAEGSEGIWLYSELYRIQCIYSE